MCRTECALRIYIWTHLSLLASLHYTFLECNFLRVRSHHIHCRIGKNPEWHNAVTIKFKHVKPFLTVISLHRVAPDQSDLYKVIVTFDGITCIIIYNVYYPMPMFKLVRWYGRRHSDAMCAAYMLVSYNHHTHWMAMQFCFVVLQPYRFVLFVFTAKQAYLLQA